MTISRATKVLALVCAGTYLTALDVTVVNVAYSTIKAALGASDLLPWIISGYSISFAAGLLTAGRMADSFGRKKAFLMGITVFSVSSMLCGLAWNVPVLIAARVLQAVGAALIVPSAMALIMPEFPVEKRAQAVGVTGAIGGLGAATGPVVGGLFTEWFGWRSIFFINVPVCIATVLIGRRLLRETSKRATRSRPDIVGAVLATGAVALLTLALTQSKSWGWNSPYTVGAIVAVVPAGLLFVRRTRVHPEPVLDLGLLDLGFVRAANITGVLYAAGFYAFNFTMIQWLREAWGYSPGHAGLAAIPAPIVSMIVSPFGGRLAQRFGHRQVAVPGLVLMAASLIAWAQLLPAQSGYFPGFFLPACGVGLGIGLTIAVLSGAASAYLPPTRFAMGSALYATGRQVGGALGIAVVAAIVAGHTGETSAYRWAFRYEAGVVLCSAVVFAMMFKPPTAAELNRSTTPVESVDR